MESRVDINEFPAYSFLGNLIGVKEGVSMAKRGGVSGVEAHVGYWLRVVSNHVSQAFMAKVEGKGVTVAEWVVLRELFEGEEMTPSVLAERLGMTRGAISKLVERVHRKGLVDKTGSEEDRRAQRLRLTASGKRLVPVLAKLADENDREFFGHLNVVERGRLAGTLQGIVERNGWKEVAVD